MQGAENGHTSDSAPQYLTFAIRGQEYGVPIRDVNEIRSATTAITSVPSTPAHVRGVINLRGVIVPIYDLRARLGVPPLEDERFAVIVVVTVASRVIGLSVDAVSDVVALDARCVQGSTSLGADVATAFVNGIAHTADRMIVLLDLERVVGIGAEPDARTPSHAAGPH